MLIKASVPTPTAYKEQPPASYQGADQWQPANPVDQVSRGNWWEIFGDPELNGLEEQIATSNQTLKVAEARFREARAAIRFSRASQFPTISTSPNAAYTKSSDYSLLTRRSTGRSYLPRTSCFRGASPFQVPLGSSSPHWTEKPLTHAVHSV